MRCNLTLKTMKPHVSTWCAQDTICAQEFLDLSYCRGHGKDLKDDTRIHRRGNSQGGCVEDT